MTKGPETVSLRDEIARTCCYWADPIKNGTCHDNYCSSACRAVTPEKQFLDMADAILSLLPPKGWRPIESAPHACHVLATRFDPDAGEWICAVVLSPPIQPFTHWMPLPEPPQGER